MEEASFVLDFFISLLYFLSQYFSFLHLFFSVLSVESGYQKEVGSLGLGILHFCIWYFLFLYFVFFIFFRCCKCWEWLLEGGGVLGPGARAESFWPTHIPGHSAVYSINVHHIWGFMFILIFFVSNSYSWHHAAFCINIQFIQRFWIQSILIHLLLVKHIYNPSTFLKGSSITINTYSYGVCYTLHIYSILPSEY